MLRLPFTFIFTGIAGFVVFHLLSLLSFAGWIGDAPRTPDGWFRVHLLILGWATMTAMGAVYQLISVVLQAKIYSERLGFAHYGLFLAGLLGLLYGFQGGRVGWIAGFATLAFAGILLFVWNLIRTLIQAAQWTPITASVACSLAGLTLTGLLGMAMGLNFAFGGWNEWHDRLFGAHIWLGSVGWFGFLIIGFSFKLLPMFNLAHGFPIRLQRVTLWLWGAGTLVGMAAFLCGSPLIWKQIGFLLITLAAIVYNLHIVQIRQRRHKKKPGAGIAWATIGAGWLALLGIAVCAVSVFFPQAVFEAKTIVLVGWGYLWGWVAMTILGYLSKIAPFLWWTHKYGPKVGKQPVPSMADLIDERQASLGLALITLALFVLLAGIGFDQIAVIRIGGSALSLFSLAYIALIIRVFTR